MRLRLRRGIFMALGVVAVALVLIWSRVFWGSFENYRIGEDYFEARDYIKAITFFDRALHWYTPFNPYIDRSAERLWQIGLDAERQGDAKLALIAFRTIRQGFYAARSFYTPGEDWVGRCDARIASLIAEQPGGQETKGEKTRHSDAQQRAEPDVFWAFVLEVGLFGWIASVIGFLVWGFADLKAPALKSRTALLWAMAVLIFYTLWIVGMVRA